MYPPIIVNMQTIAQDERKMVSCRISKSLDRAIEDIAYRRDCPKQDVMEAALRAYVADPERDSGPNRSSADAA